MKTKLKQFFCCHTYKWTFIDPESGYPQLADGRDIKMRKSGFAYNDVRERCIKCNKQK